MNDVQLADLTDDVLDVLTILLLVLVVEVFANVVFAVMLAIRLGSAAGIGAYIIEIVSWPMLAESAVAGPGGAETLAAAIVSYAVAVAVVYVTVRVSS